LETTESEEDPFYEAYHVAEPMDDSMRPRIVGIKACLDWLVGEDAYEFSIRRALGIDPPEMISLLAYNDQGDAIVLLSQAPMPDGSYETYSTTLGTYDLETNTFVATEVSICFFYETATGRVIPSCIGEDRCEEYDELNARWQEVKNGG